MSWDAAKILTYVNEKLLKMQQQGTIIGSLEPDLTATQSNKPSAHSSLPMSVLRRMAVAAAKEAHNANKNHKLSYSSVANTNSMEPFIDDNCIVLLEYTNKDTIYYPGDIVIYEAKNGRIIHTLKEKTTFLGKPAWIIQGYNNFLPDGKIPEENIVQRYVGHFVGPQIREGD